MQEADGTIIVYGKRLGFFRKIWKGIKNAGDDLFLLRNLNDSNHFNVTKYFRVILLNYELENCGIWTFCIHYYISCPHIFRIIPISFLTIPEINPKKFGNARLFLHFNFEMRKLGIDQHGKVMKKANRRNVLPNGYANWTQLFLDMNLVGIVHYSTLAPKTETMVLRVESIPGDRRSKNRLEIDFEFIKARLFEEFFLNSSLDKTVCGLLHELVIARQDKSDIYQNLERASKEIRILGELITTARDNPPLVLDPLDNLN